MKTIVTGFMTILLLGVIIIFLPSCENDYPESIWDPNEPSKPQPVIEQIVPADSSYAGVGELVIKGKNYSSVPDENLVFFDGNKATTVSASETQLTIKSPNVTGESLEVKIAVHGAELFSEPVYYKLKAAVSTIGNFKEADKLIVLAVDAQENIYVNLEGKVIKKINPTGETTHHADVSFLKANGMKMGPGNTLYAAFAAGRLKKVATIGPDGSEGTYAFVPGIPRALDFDENGNMWIAVDKDIYMGKPDQSTTQITSYPLTLHNVRVFNGYVYVLGSDENTGEAKIWRNEIQGESLGNMELVLDIAAATWLDGAAVYSFTFSADGEMYLGTDHAEDAILIYNPTDESHDVLFPGLILPNVTSLSWGEGIYLYAIQKLVQDQQTEYKVLKIDVGKAGAPYYGRQ